MEEETNSKTVIKISIWSVIIIILLLAFWSSATIVGAGEQAVVTRLGAVKGDTLKSGFHFIAPFIDKAEIMDIREQKEQVDADSASSDLQAVNTTIALNYHLDAGRTNDLYREVGLLYKQRVIDPSIQESIKASTAKFTAEELITKRSEVKEQAKIILSERLAKRYIILDDLSIVNFSFSPEFSKAVEAKVTANQKLLEAQYKLETAQKDAQAQLAQKTSLSPELLQKMAIDKWNGTMPTYVGGNAFMNIPLITN